MRVPEHGYRDELIGHVGGHRDVNGASGFGLSDEHRTALRTEAAENVKRVECYDDPESWTRDTHQSPYRMMPFVDFKTAWHPIE